jgi:hypothetical protein
MDFGPEPVGEAFDGENSLEEEGQNGGPAEGSPAGVWTKKKAKKKQKRKGPASSACQTISSTQMRTQSSMTFSAISITHVLHAIDTLTGPGSGYSSFCGPVEARPSK